MNYEQALRLWGAAKLDGENERLKRESGKRPYLRWHWGKADPSTVTVNFVFHEGDSCPTCGYDGRAAVEFRGLSDLGERMEFDIAPEDFNFAQVLGEILAVGE